MALKDKIAFGMSLPHRSPDPIDVAAVKRVAQRAEALGFRDLWVTENTLDHVTSFDPVVILTYAAAMTRTIRLGVSVAVLPVHDPRLMAHQWATLDHVSGGRAILGVGLGRAEHCIQFQVPPEADRRALGDVVVGREEQPVLEIDGHSSPSPLAASSSDLNALSSTMSGKPTRMRVTPASSYSPISSSALAGLRSS